MNRKMRWIHSIKTKQLSLLFVIIFFIMVCSFLFFRSSTKTAENSIYEKMESQAEYYLNSVEYQIFGIMQQQADFFSDRKLAFLTDRELIQNDYDRRETLLSIQDRLFSLKYSNKLIDSVILYVPGADYIITPSRVANFTQEDREQLELLKGQIGQLVPMGRDLSYAMTEGPFEEGSNPNFCLQVILSEQQISDNLNSFTAVNGGTCLYNEETGWFLEDTAGVLEGGDVLERLSEMNIRELSRVPDIWIDHKIYLVSIAESEYLGMLIQYYPKESIMAQTRRYSRLFAVFVGAAALMAVLFSQYTERMVNRPLKKLSKAFDVLKQGRMDIRISHSSQDEFSYIYEGFNHMTMELHRLIDEVYVQKDLAQKAELKQLQAQINPHFLYNSFFVLSRRVQRGDMENSRLLAEYLGTYFQFLTRNTSDTVSLELEMEHAQCYARIQGTRFASRIQVILEEMPKNLHHIQVPRLIVQPILENAFEHGLEDKEEDGILQVNYKVGAEEIWIMIENNGDITNDHVAAMQERLEEDYKGEVTGMINIHRRLKSFYKGKGGLSIERGHMGGICVTLKIPVSFVV